MGRILCIEVPADVAAALAGLLAPMPVLAAASTPEGMARLDEDRQGTDVVLIGPEAAEPVRTAQRVYARAPDAAVLILSAGPCAPLERAIRFAPFLGDVHCHSMTESAPAACAALAGEIAQAARRTAERRRQRERLRALLPDAPRSPELQASYYLGRLFDQAPVAIFITDAEGEVLSMNVRAAALFGQSERQLLGAPLQGLFSAAEGRRLAALLRQAAEGTAQGLFEREAAQPSQTPQVLEATASPLYVGEGQLGHQVLFQDVSARMLAERERERALRRLKILAGVGQLLSASLDYERTLEEAVQLAVPELADWCFVEIIDDDGSFQRVAVAHADPAQVELAQRLRRRYRFLPDAPHGVSRVLRSGQAELTREVPAELLDLIATDEEHRRLLERLAIRAYIVAPLLARGQVIGALTIISSDRRYDAADLSLAEDLATRAAQAIDSARLYRAAQEAIGVRDEFISVASHELRTPLTPLQLQLQSIQRSLRMQLPDAAGPPAGLGERIDRALRQTERLGMLVENLLDFSRIGAGQLWLREEAVDLAAATREVAGRFAPVMEAAGCVLTLEADVPLSGRWDRLRLEQVVSNLLSNALKYGAGRPVHVSVSTTGPAEAPRAVLEVRDQGIGIGPRDQARIFERFERAHADQHYGGLGLGLWIVRRIVEALGGTISVTSEPGAGATFRVELPRR